MTTAVAQVLKGTERVLADGFSRFMLHYRFHADFCNPASGNGKGNVENKEFRPNPLQFAVDAPVLNYTPNLSAYDGLMGGDVSV